LSGNGSSVHALQGRRAGVVSRLLAACVDLPVVLIGLGLVYLGISGAMFLLRGDRFRFPSPGVLGAVGIGQLVLILYLAIGWSTIGRTPGQQVAGLRVLDRRGSRPRLGLSLLRALLCVVFPIGLLWSAVSRTNASVQDLILRTSVVYDWRSHNARRQVEPKDAAVTK